MQLYPRSASTSSVVECLVWVRHSRLHIFWILLRLSEISGVAGFTLGGGYGWSTQQYGLTIDTVTSFDLVTPTGNIMTVTEQSNHDLFFGLRVCLPPVRDHVDAYPQISGRWK